MSRLLLRQALIRSTPRLTCYRCTSQWSNRSHTCGELRPEHRDQRVVLSGWVQYVRLGGRFVLLRDAHGVTQLVLPEAGAGSVDRLTLESVLKVEGVVRRRPEGSDNPSMETGQVEVEVTKLEELSRAPPKMPVRGWEHNQARFYSNVFLAVHETLCSFL